MQGAMLTENIIIKEPSKNLRTLGRNALAGKWKIAIITMIVFFLITSVPPAIFDAIFGTNVVTNFTTNGYTYGIDADTYAQFINNMPHYCTLSSIYTLVVTGPLNLGLALFVLGVFRGATLHVEDILLGFEKFGKALGLYLFQLLFIFLWTLLFVVPGIIAAIRYSQAFFILADDNTKGIRQCMDESKIMMKGNKGKFFCLGLSFIGWVILSEIPSSIFGNIGNAVSNNGFVIAIFAIIGSLFMAPVMAYMYTTFAGFYEILARHLIKETMPIPVTAEEAQKAYSEINSLGDESEKETEASVEEVPEEASVEEVTEERPIVETVEETPAEEVPAEEVAEEVKEESDEQ